jgi:hypothetical protein
MKFTEKYEILELLTSGRVSTFLARERASREQAVVHTFECPATFPVESRNSAILKHFASIAPRPAEPATEVGFDEGSSSAFVVTKVPAPGALQSWVRAYRSFSGGERSGGETREVGGVDENATAELSASEVERLLKQSGRPKSQRPLEASPTISTEPLSVSAPANPAEQKGEFTSLFEEPGAFQRLSGGGATGKSAPAVPAGPFSAGPAETPTDLPTNYGAATPSSRAMPASPEPGLPEPGLPELGLPEPGSFTQQFFSGADDPSDRPGFGSVPAPEQSGVKEPGAFTKEFLAISGKSTQSAKPVADEGTNWEGKPAKSSPPAPMFSSMAKPVSPAPKSPADKFDSGPEALKSGTGEFTSFFRGPFDQPSPPDKPIEYPDPVQASPPPRAGDFTQMFGDENRLKAKESPSIRPPERQATQAPSFTQIFSEEDKGGARLGDLRLDPDPPAPTSLKPPIGSPASPSGTPFTFSGTASPVSFHGGGFSPSEAARGSSSGENTFLNQSGRSDATNVFKPRGGDAPPMAPEAPSGPSDFTMFISSSQLKASLPPGPANPGAQNPAARVPALPMPPMPSYAAPAPPAMPPAPTPQMAVPQAPPAPRLSAPPPGRAASYWPLITVLTILFAIAALLVMYFALKH